MALITLARAQMVPSLASANAAYLTLLIDAAGDMAERYCKRVFTSTTYTDEVYDGDGSTLMQLDRFPVTTLTTVKVVETDETETSCAGSQFRIDGAIGEIKFKPQATSTYVYFPTGYQNIKVTYVAGYPTIPEAVQEAVAQICAWIHAEASATPGIESWKLGDAAVKYKVPGANMPLLPPLVRELLSTYRQVIP